MSTLATDRRKRQTSIPLDSLLACALGGDFDLFGPAHRNIRDVTDDSRGVTPDCLFVGVRGENVDGARFAAEAQARGAAAVVIEKSATVECPGTVVRVDDSRAAVAKIASEFYGLRGIQQRGGLTAVGVTGTNGKSTFGYMLRSLIKSAGRRAALFGTIEYDLVGRKLPSSLTTPDAINLTKHLVEAHEAGATDAVLEVSSHSLEQRRVDGIQFHSAVFTNLTQDHLDYHKTMEQYGSAKRRLFDELSEKATACVNVDDPWGGRMVERCRARVIRYGFMDDADIRATVVSEDRIGGRFTLNWGRECVEIRTPLVGRHNIYNALAAAAAGVSLGLDLATIQRGLAALANVPGRLQRVDANGLGFDVFVDYAHTDDALRNVLQAVRPLTRGKLWCVFGCGGDRDPKKRPLMGKAVAECADYFVVTSDNPRTEDPNKIIADIESGLGGSFAGRRTTIPDRREAICHAVGALTAGDCLVVAGKGHEDYQILGKTKIHFDDAEVVAEAIAARAGAGTCGP